MKARRIPVPTIGGLTLAVFAGLLVIVFTGLFRAPFAPDARDVRVEFPRAPQLQVGDQVRTDGNIDGKVTDLQPGRDGRGVFATLRVNRDAGPIYADASAHLRIKTLLGGAFYVDLDRGTVAAGMLGDRVIPADRTSQATEIEDISDIFRGGALGGVRSMPRELADALRDPAALSGALRTFNDVAPSAQTALSATRGQAPGADLVDVVRSGERAITALDSPRDELRTLVSGAAAVMATTARRGDELRTFQHRGATVNAETRRTLARLETTLVTTERLAERLRGPAADVAPTLAALRPTAARAAALLITARPLVRDLQDSVTSLRRAGRTGVPLLRALDPALERIDRTILPYFAEKDPQTGKSTSVMIGGFAAGFGGAAGQQDRNGHFVRFPATIGASSVYLPCHSSLIEPDAPSQVACDTIQEALKGYLTYLPQLPATRGGR